MTVLALQKGIIYGPIASRRLGRSLGINLSPTREKTCSFDCVYCHYGPTRYRVSPAGRFAADAPSADDVASALAAGLAEIAAPDYITFSGNGEPTLHPAFGAVVSAVEEVRARACAGAKLAILSNSSTVGDAGVREALAELDLRIMKLDAGTAELFRAVNSPAPDVDFETVVAGLKELADFTVQSCFLTGEPDNAGEKTVEAYVAVIKNIKPARVQVYTTDRPVASAAVCKVPRDRLAAIARRIAEEAGVPADVF